MSDRPDIVITEFMDDGPVGDLQPGFTVHRDHTLWERPDDLRALGSGARALIVRNKTGVGEALLDACPDLRVIGRLGVGLDNIDVPACEKRNIRVCPATGANAAAVAEYVLMAALTLLRGVTGQSSDLISGRWPREALRGGREIGGRTIGLIGFGSIGQETGRRARALGAMVMAHDPGVPETDAAWSGARRVSLATLLAEADVISLHVPLIDATRHLIDAAALAQMKPDAVLINTARGGIVDEDAIVGALRSDRLGGAALDVFQEEPPSKAAMAKFAGLENIILTPHIAGLSQDANARVSRVTVDNVLAVLNASPKTS